MTRLVLVDDHDIVRMGLSMMIAGAKDFELVGELPNGSGVVDFVREKHADMVLLDIRMPEVDGLAALMELRRELPGVKVCIVSTSEVESDIRTAVGLGAAGYIIKSTPPREMLEAIRTVATGGTFYSPVVQEVMNQGASYTELSVREKEVLEQMARGLSNTDISSVLDITLETVKMHVRHILAKLDTAGRTEAVARAYALGILKACAAALAGVFAITADAAEPLFDDAYTSDPAPLISGGRLYLYTGHDADDADEFKNPDWRCYSTADGSTWTSHGAVARPTDHPWGEENSAWASHAVERDGKFFLYTSVRQKDDGRMAIGVLTANSPTGPFSDPLGRPLVSHPGCFGDYDPDVLFDGDDVYLFWGNFELHCAKLRPDMVSIDPSFGKNGIEIVKTPDNYLVGPWVWKRGGMYYLAYTSNGMPAGTAYATAPGPLGPWTYRGWLMKPDRACGGAQPAVVDFAGRHLLFGWNRARYAKLTPPPRPMRERRSVCAVAFEYGPDGLIATLPAWEKCPEPFGGK